MSQRLKEEGRLAKERSIRGLDARKPLPINAARMISARLDEMLSYEPYLNDPDEVHQLHQMRIAAKRLRYTLEIFQEYYSTYTPNGNLYDRMVDAIKKLQAILGEIHDKDVLMPRLHRQLALLMHDGYGRDANGDPIVGVHHVDLDACEGMLALCRRTREARDQKFKQLSDEWKLLCEQHLFDEVPAVLSDAEWQEEQELKPASSSKIEHAHRTIGNEEDDNSHPA